MDTYPSSLMLESNSVLFKEKQKPSQSSLLVQIKNNGIHVCSVPSFATATLRWAGWLLIHCVQPSKGKKSVVGRICISYILGHTTIVLDLVFMYVQGSPVFVAFNPIDDIYPMNQMYPVVGGECYFLL